MATEETLHGYLNEPISSKNLGNLDPDDFSTNENRPYPLGAGKLIVTGFWVGQIYDQFTKDAPVERPGKK